MKIKLDFITNSSSTAYVMLLNDQMDIKNDLKKLYKSGESLYIRNIMNDQGFEDFQELYLFIKNIFDELLDKREYSSWENGNYDVVYLLANELYKDYIIYEFNTGSSDCTWIDLVGKSKILKILSKLK